MESHWKELPLERVLTFIEPGPVVLVTTFDGKRNNVMTISWTMAIDFDRHIVLTTGSWNYSFGALMERRECVVCIPPADMIETVVRIGDVSGADTDKFRRFGLTALPAATVAAPLIDGCMACLECRVVDHVEPYGFVVVEVLRVVVTTACRDRRLVLAVGDGTFVADGERYDCRALMADKLPPGL